MRDDENIIEILDDQVEKMFSNIKNLEQKNFNLTHKLIEVQASSDFHKTAFESLKIKYDALKLASSFLGSEENKKETKLKINALIREINYCIAQLSTS